MVIAALNNSQFAAFSERLGLADLPKDPRFATNPLRVKNRKALIGTRNRVRVILNLIPVVLSGVCLFDGLSLFRVAENNTDDLSPRHFTLVSRDPFP